LFKFLIKECYLDKSLSKGKEKILGEKLTFLNRFGTLGMLIKNDIRLIIRNVRPRQDKRHPHAALADPTLNR
jgi:hypothetical protein